MLRVTGSISANTGVAPTSMMTLAVATHDTGVVMTSSPGPMPAMRSAISMVQVPELKVRTGRPPKYSDSWASNVCTFGPLVIQPERSTSPTAAMVASSMVGLEKGKKGRVEVMGRCSWVDYAVRVVAEAACATGIGGLAWLF